MEAIPHLMQAVLAEPGGLQRLMQLATPRPGSHDVLVRVAASAVNPLDAKILAGAADHARQTMPAILGMDMAGIVVARAPGGTDLAEGDPVYGMAGGVGGHAGSLAEYMAVDSRLLARKPANFTMREAAAVPLAFITAWEGLVDRAGLRAGQRVLVIGGAGSVGQMALQIIRARSAVAIGTGGRSGRDIIEHLGARFVDKAVPPATIVAQETGGRGFDIVFDTAGGASLDAAFTMVRRFGHVVSVLGWGTHALAPLSLQAATYSGVFTLLPLLTGEGLAHHGEILAQATVLAEAGKLVPTLDGRHFTLATAGEAYRAMTAGTARGKLVVDVSEEAGS